MKRTDRGLETEILERDAASQGPLKIEPLALQGRKTRRFGLPLFFGIVVVIAVLAMTSRFAAYFAGPTSSPTSSAPIPWIDTTVAPTTPLDSQPAPSQGRVLSLDAAIPGANGYFAHGTAGDFTLELTNTTGQPMALTPCPTYRIFVIPDDGLAPERMLNCAAIQAAVGPELADGQTMSLAMVFTPTEADPVGNQQLEWVWDSPTGYQSVALYNVYIAH